MKIKKPAHIKKMNKSQNNSFKSKLEKKEIIWSLQYHTIVQLIKTTFHQCEHSWNNKIMVQLMEAYIFT